MKLSELVNKIIECSAKYYETGDSPVSDTEFDAMIEKLREQCPDHPVLTTTGWGYEVLDGVEHPYHQITGISQKYKNLAKLPEMMEGDTAVITPKLDGASVVLYYENNVLTNCITRGDGKYGRDVTVHLRTRVPLKLRNRLYSDMKDTPFTGYIRCEVVISNENFRKYFPDGKSSRNCATGLLGQKTPDTLVQYLDVIPVTIYDRGCDKFAHHCSALWEELVENQFEAKFKYKEITYKDTFSVCTKDLMLELCPDYTCDGLVIYADWKKITKMFAIKFDDEQVETTVTKIEWVTHGTGKLFPTVHYTPVEISGCTATKASGKSHAFIVDNDIQPGTKITLVRSGEVIPNIVAVLPIRKTVYRTGAQYKPKCSYGCPEEYLDIEGAHIYCRNAECPALTDAMFERLINTFAPKGYSDAMRNAVMKMFNRNIFTFLKYYKILGRVDVFNLGIKGLTSLGERLTVQMITDMSAWKLRLHQLVDIAVVEYFGDAQAKVIETKAGSDVALTEWAKNHVIIDPDLLINTTAGRNWERRHSLIKELLKYFTLYVPTWHTVRDYEGHVCITGRIENGSKERFAKEYIESRGYKWVKTLTDATILLYAGGHTESAKCKQAKKKGIPIISVEDWVKENYYTGG